MASKRGIFLVLLLNGKGGSQVHVTAARRDAPSSVRGRRPPLLTDPLGSFLLFQCIGTTLGIPRVNVWRRDFMSISKIVVSVEIPSNNSTRQLTTSQPIASVFTYIWRICRIDNWRCGSSSRCLEWTSCLYTHIATNDCCFKISAKWSCKGAGIAQSILKLRQNCWSTWSQLGMMTLSR